MVLGTALGVAGTATAAAGAWQLVAPLLLAGLVVAELGLVLCTPAIVGLATRAGRVLPPAARIALRDTSRNRTVAAPAISAVMAAVMASLAVGMVLTASTARAQAEYRPLGRVGDVFVFAADADRILVRYRADEALGRAITAHRDWIAEQTLAVELADGADLPSGARDAPVEGMGFRFTIETRS